MDDSRFNQSPWMTPRSLDSATIDRYWSYGLLVVALLLLLVNLGGLPLRDWDEGTVAQVAKEIAQAPAGSLRWAFPTLIGEPYLNKPPLVHTLMAIAFRLWGVSEWTARLPGALFTALSVPLLYALGREVFGRRPPALFAALVYLTTLQVARLGRLAMLDGAVLFFSILLFWCVLRSRRNVRFALAVGLSLGLLCLTKGVMLGLLMGAIAVCFLGWDTPRLLSQPYLGWGVVLGLLPVGLWYGAQWQQYGVEALNLNLVNQTFSRIWNPVERNDGPPWYYALELLKYGIPWLVFWPMALQNAWNNRGLGWAKLSLLWGGLYFTAISLMATKLPWYVLPLYPALALATGAQLAVLWEKGRRTLLSYPHFKGYSIGWAVLFTLLAIAALGGVFFFSALTRPRETDLAFLSAVVCLTMLVVALLVLQHNPQFISVLLWGTYVALMMLMLSPHWNWELAESYPVKPVAALIQQQTPPGEVIYTSEPGHRPSLIFYSDRPVIPQPLATLESLWQQNSQVYLLLDEAALQNLRLDNVRSLGRAEGWTLVTRQLHPAE